MKVTLEFDTEHIFQSRIRRYFDLYFAKKLKAHEVTTMLHWSRMDFERAVAGIVFPIMNGAGRVAVVQADGSRKEQ